MHMTCICTYIAIFSCMQIICIQISAEIQNYLTNHITKGNIPSYQLYLHLRDILKLAQNIPSKYVLCVRICIIHNVHMLTVLHKSAAVC